MPEAATQKELREQRKDIKEEREALFGEMRELHTACRQFEAKKGDERDAAWNENYNETVSKLEVLATQSTRLGHELGMIEAQLQSEVSPLDGLLNGDGAALGGELEPSDKLTAEYRRVMQEHTFRNGRNGRRSPVNFNNHIAQTPVAPGSTQTKDLDLRMLASPKYEELWGRYVVDLAMNNKTDFNPVKAFADATGQAPRVGETQGVIPCPLRLIRLMQCNCDEGVFIRRYANVIPVTNACKLGIVKRKNRVRSAALGCECVKVPKSGLPDIEEKQLEPFIWTQGAETCRALLRCVLVNPVDMLFEDMAWDQRLFLEELYLFGEGRQGPLGIFTDDELLPAPLTQAEYDDPNLMVEALRQFICSIPFECLTSRSNVWVLSHEMWCKLMKAKDCCGRSLWFREGEDSFAETPWRASLFGFPIEVVSPGIDKGRLASRPFAFGDLSTYTIADFPFGTGLESEVDIDCDKICWVKREYTDGMALCNNQICVGRIVTEDAKAALVEQKMNSLYGLG